MELLAVLMAISITTQGAIPVIQKKLAPQGTVQALLVTMTVSIIAMLLFLPVSAAISGSATTHIDLLVSLLMVLAGVLYAFANLMFFLLPARTGASVFGTILTFRVVPMAILSTLFIGEVMTPLKVLGVTLVIAGVIWATWRRYHERTKAERLAVFGLIAGTMAFGSAIAIDAIIVKEIGTAAYLPIRLLLPALLLAMVYLPLATFKGEWGIRATFTRTRVALLAGISLFIPISASTLLWAMESATNPAALSAVHQLSLFITIVIEAIMIGSVWRTISKHLLPATICCFGVALTLLG